MLDSLDGFQAHNRSAFQLSVCRWGLDVRWLGCAGGRSSNPADNPIFAAGKLVLFSWLTTDSCLAASLEVVWTDARRLGSLPRHSPQREIPYLRDDWGRRCRQLGAQ